MQDLVRTPDAVADRAREFVGKEQQVDDPLDADFATMDATVAGVCATGPQDRTPLERF